jgi:hypothetical protein
MNRDEKLARPAGVSPGIIVASGRMIIRPSEPGGGTWIALNDRGVSFGLINWYSVAERAREASVSRGAVVNSVAAQVESRLADGVLATLHLPQINPFRLIGVFPAEQRVIEWRWNGRRLSDVSHKWETSVWVSSGFDEAQAQATRSRTFREAFEHDARHDSSWLRRFHSSHHPARGPFSVCMHRPDAATVSFTEIEVSKQSGNMLYHGDAPCTRFTGRGQGISLALSW